MASVTNHTGMPITLPNLMVVPPKSQITCDNSDINGAASLPTLQTLRFAGDLTFTFDEPFSDLVRPEPETAEPAPAAPETMAAPTAAPPPAGKKG